MKIEVIAHQPRLEGGTVSVKRHVFTTPIAELRKLAEEDRKRCDWCFADYFQHAKEHDSDLYDFWHVNSPWDAEEVCDNLCPECARHLERNGCDEYFYCDACNRETPYNNGHRVYYRYDADGGMVCVACWQRQTFEDNSIIEHFVEDEESIPFDFYDHDELKAAGFEEFEDFYISGRASVEALRERCRELLDDGYHVIIDQGMTSILGDDIALTFWVKPLAPGDAEWA